jgi:pimeloyl-ACP methyl ester carboxylesterase
MPELAFDQIADETVLRRMHDTVMQPYAALGYPNIWIAGISIGGYVAIAYAHRYPGRLKGLLLLAPYLGNRITTGEIALAGGINAWAPSAIPIDDIERGNWYWLKHQANTTEVHLGFGQDDRFAESIEMMATILPDEHVDKISGGHVWPVWQQLWHNFLDKRFSN